MLLDPADGPDQDILPQAQHHGRSRDTDDATNHVDHRAYAPVSNTNSAAILVNRALAFDVGYHGIWDRIGNRICKPESSRRTGP